MVQVEYIEAESMILCCEIYKLCCEIFILCEIMCLYFIYKKYHRLNDDQSGIIPIVNLNFYFCTIVSNQIEIQIGYQSG